MFVQEAHIQEKNLNCIDYLSFQDSKTLSDVRGSIFSFVSMNKDKYCISPEGN
jgi:ribonuclease HIII